VFCTPFLYTGYELLLCRGIGINPLVVSMYLRQKNDHELPVFGAHVNVDERRVI